MHTSRVNSVQTGTRAVRPGGLTDPRDRMVVQAYYSIHSRVCPRLIRYWWERFAAAFGPERARAVLQRVRQGEFAPGVGEVLPRRVPETYFWERVTEPCLGPQGPQGHTWVCRGEDGREIYRGPSVLTPAEVRYRLKHRPGLAD